MSDYTYMLVDGQKVQLEVHPDSIITEGFVLEDGSIIYAVVGIEEQYKLFSLQNTQQYH